MRLSGRLLVTFGSVLVWGLIASAPAQADLHNRGNGMSSAGVQGSAWLQDVTRLPEPASLVLLAMGMFGAASLARRWRPAVTAPVTT